MNFQYWPLSTRSQMVQLCLEEKRLDYTPIVINAHSGVNLEPEFMRINPKGTLPVLRDGPNVLADCRTILLYLDQYDEPLGKNAVERNLVSAWIARIDAWDESAFSQAVMPGTVGKQYRGPMSKFKRRVIIARMAKHPELAGAYSQKLQDIQAREARARSPEHLQEMQRQLAAMLDLADNQLGITQFLAGSAMSIADCMFLPILARIFLLKKDKELFGLRPNVSNYYARMMTRESALKVITSHQGWSAYCLMAPTVISIKVRTLMKRY